MNAFDNVVSGFNSTGWRPDNEGFTSLLREQAMEYAALQKALSTGNGLVTGGTTGGAALRKQFLFDELERTSFDQRDLMLMRLCPKRHAKSTLIEWTTRGVYGSVGDGFIGESGATGAYDAQYADDNYERQTETIKFLAEGRQVTLPSQYVDSVEDPMKAARVGLTMSIMAKGNNAGYFGDATKSSNQFNGMIAQLVSWINVHNEDAGILYDCQGKPIDKYILQDAAIQNRKRFGKADLLLMSSTAYGDSTTLLWPEARSAEGHGGDFGQQFRRFIGPNGNIIVEDDPALIAGQPLRIDGPASDGLARSTANADAGNLPWAANPFVAVSGAVGVQALAPGAGNWWVNGSSNKDAGPIVVPALPTGVGTAMGGNNTNNLGAGNYYFAASVVNGGLESPAYIYGAGTQASVNTITGTPTAIAATAGQAIQLDFDTTTPQITGLGSTYARANVKIRIYRYGGPGAAAPTRLSQFLFLQEIGVPTAGNARVVDNGANIPGTDNAFLITRKKGNEEGWCYLQLLPLMQRTLPLNAMSDQFVLLWFATMFLKIRRHHIHFRNVGRAS